MLPQFAYLLVIMIWATTPLAIKLGGESFAPLAGLSLRIVLAFIVGSAICTLAGYAGLNIRQHWKLYAVASISLFPNMALVYTAATYISSGLIALLFGLTPFYTAVLSKPLLGESNLQPRKVVAIAIAVVGLGLIVADSISLGANTTGGVLLMLLSNLLFSGSALWVKRINLTLSVAPVEQALGAMAFSLPGLLISWLLVVGYDLVQPSPTALVSLLYLALCGSLLGFVAYQAAPTPDAAPIAKDAAASETQTPPPATIDAAPVAAVPDAAPPDAAPKKAKKDKRRRRRPRNDDDPFGSIH